MEWIKCSEKTPPYNSTVLAWDESESGPVIFKTYETGMYKASLRSYMLNMKITHWAEITPPTE